MKNTLYLTLFLISFFSVNAQVDYSNWPMANGRLSFNGTPDPKFVLDVPAGSYFDKFKYSFYPLVMYSDPATGRPLAMLAGGILLNRFYDTIPGLGDRYLTNCGADEYNLGLLPRPENPRHVYAITQYSAHGVAVAQETGLQTRCNYSPYIGLYATLMDVDANGGRGQIIKSEFQLPFHASDGLSFIKHQNGRDYWILAAGGVNGGSHKSYLVDKNGISTSPIVSSHGPARQGGSSSYINFMHASSDGKTFVQTNGYNKNSLEIYAFDNSTGRTTNFTLLSLDAGDIVHQAVISHDNSKLYVATYSQVNCGTLYKLYQFELKSSNIAATKYLLAKRGNVEFAPMQRSLDGNIYIGPVWHGYNIYFDCIQFPNQPKAASGLTERYFLLSDNMGNEHRPFMPNNPVNDVTFQMAEPQAIDFGFADTTNLCGQTATLAAPAGYAEYRWSTGETTRTITVVRPGIYSVLAGDASFKKPKAFGDTYIKTGGEPIGLGKDTTACPNTPVQLKVPWSFTNVLWNDGDTSHIKMVMPPGGKTVVSATDRHGCRSWDSLCVGFKYYPRTEFGPDTVLCESQILKLRMEPDIWYGSKPFTAKWSTGETVIAIEVTKPGTYWGTIQQDGCMNSDTIRVSFVTSNAVSLGRDTMICQGASLTLRTGQPGAGHLWNNGSSADTLLIKEPGEYWVKVFSTGCTVSDTINVSFTDPPAKAFGADTSFCEGAGMNLGNDAVPGIAGVLWNTGATTPSIVVKNAGVFWRKTQSVNGCTSIDTITVRMLTAPLFSLGADSVLCYNSVLTLAPIPAQNSLHWQNGSQAPYYQVNSAGAYWARATASNGCTYTDTVQVQYETALEIKLGNDSAVCAYTPVPLHFTSNTNRLLWSTGAIGSNQIVANQPGWYWAEAGTGVCAIRDSIQITWKPNPPENLLGADTSICEGKSLQLDATTTGATYNWSQPHTKATLLADKAGLYWVDVNLDGCTKRSSIVINHTLKPRFFLGNDTLLCRGQKLQLSAPSTGDYRWQNGSTAPVLVVSEPASYSLTVTNNCGSTTDEILVDIGSCYVQVPNAFTPNRDGLNDVFRVKYPEFIKTFHMAVFDRWGTMLFQTLDPRAGWNGTSHGMELPSGNYVWTISYNDIDGKTENLRGWVILLR